MDQKRVFRNSMMGFNKDDVNKYISELSRKLDGVLSERDKAIETLEEAKHHYALAMDENDKIKENMQAKDAEINSLKRANETMQDRAKAHYEERIKNAKEFEALNARLSGLEGDIPELKTRAEKYERNAMHIAEAMISAREEAEHILNKAMSDAAFVREQILKELDSIGSRADELGQKYDDVRNSTFEATERFKEVIDSLYGELEGARKKIVGMKEDMSTQEEL